MKFSTSQKSGFCFLFVGIFSLDLASLIKPLALLILTTFSIDIFEKSLVKSLTLLSGINLRASGKANSTSPRMICRISSPFL